MDWYASYLRSKPFRCRIRFHHWTAWDRALVRRYVPVRGQEGLIAVTLRQERRCHLCGVGEVRKHPERLISPSDAYAPITDFERKHLRTLPLLDLSRPKSEEWSEHHPFDPPGRYSNPNRLLCRLGIHYELSTRGDFDECSACGLNVPRGRHELARAGTENALRHLC